jgi:hypothetical protein
MFNEISPEVAEVLSAKHVPGQPTAAAIGARGANELRDIAIGNAHPAYRVKAMTALGPESADVFRRALNDRSADDTVRAAGATMLSRIGVEGAEDALAAALDSEPSDAVRHKIVSGLARIGGATSARALDEARYASGDLARHASFARTLIAYRSGDDVDPLEAPDESLAPAETITYAELFPSNPYVAATVVAQLAPDSYGVQLGEHTVATFDCDGQRWALATDVRLTDPATLTRPVIVGIVAVQAPADESFHAAMVVLSHPDPERGVRLSVNRLDGRSTYFGYGQPSRNGIEFTVDALRVPGALEKTIDGRLVDGLLTEVRVRAGLRFPPREPIPMQR